MFRMWAKKQWKKIKEIKEDACREDQPVLPEIIWSPPRGSSVYLAHISNKEPSDEVLPPSAADPPSAAEGNVGSAGSEFQGEHKKNHANKQTKKRRSFTPANMDPLILVYFVCLISLAGFQ